MPPSRNPRIISVAMLSSEYPPHIFGGLGTHVAGITNALASKIECHLFVPEHNDYCLANRDLDLHMVPMARETSNLRLWISYCLSAVDSLVDKGIRLDIVHCHDWMTALAGVAIRNRLSIPLTYNVHLPQKRDTSRHLENLALATAELVLVNSHSVQVELERSSLPIHRIEVVPNGVDVTAFRPGPAWPGDDGYILFVGRIVPQKGIDVLLKAFAAVLRRCANARLVIVGSGDLEFYFERIARLLGVFQQVSFVSWKTGIDLVDLFQRCRMLVAPSYYEPFGIVALEAMACGRPVIASAVGGFPEIIEDGRQGYLVPVAKHLAFAQRIVELLEKAEVARAMGVAALERSRLYTWDASADATRSFYTETISAGRRQDDHRRLRGLTRELLRGLPEDLRAPVRSLLEITPDQKGR